ncbi:hypothetical protein B296_00053352, partial [Ensete ventricosum]
GEGRRGRRREGKDGVRERGELRRWTRDGGGRRDRGRGAATVKEEEKEKERDTGGQRRRIRQVR